MHEKSMLRTAADVTAGAAGIAVLFLPWHLIVCMLSWALSGESSLLLLPCSAVCSGILTAGLVKSPTLRQGIVKVLFAALLTLLYWRMQAEWRLHDRALDLVLPEYGRQSVGGGFAAFLLLCTTALGVLIGSIAGLSACKREEHAKIWHSLQTAAYVCCAVLLLLVAGLAVTLPPYHPVYG